MLEYIVSILVFFIIGFILFKRSDKEQIQLEHVLSSLLISLSVFFIIKYNLVSDKEPMMSGNYFDV